MRPGSFTGASKTRHGRFEEADGGTLFLDELGTLSKPAQDRLLRAVEYGEITRIGASKPIQVDVRIVAATNENLPALVEKGRFRADLLDRLSFEVVTLPPMRARSGDIPCSWTISGGAWRSSSNGPTGRVFRRALVAEMEAYPWPGNVRELRNVVERAVYRCGGSRSGRSTRSSSTRSIRPGRRRQRRATPLSPTAEPAAVAEAEAAVGAPHRPYRRAISASAVSDYERALLEDALAANRFNQRATASALGLSYDQLRHALKRHKLLETDAA